MNISDLLDPEKMDRLDRQFKPVKFKDAAKKHNKNQEDNASVLNNLNHDVVTEDFSDSPILAK